MQPETLLLHVHTVAQNGVTTCNLTAGVDEPVGCGLEHRVVPVDTKNGRAFVTNSQNEVRKSEGPAVFTVPAAFLACLHRTQHTGTFVVLSRPVVKFTCPVVDVLRHRFSELLYGDRTRACFMRGGKSCAGTLLPLVEEVVALPRVAARRLLLRARQQRPKREIAAALVTVRNTVKANIRRSVAAAQCYAHSVNTLMAKAHIVVARLLEDEDVDWSPDPNDPDETGIVDIPDFDTALQRLGFSVPKASSYGGWQKQVKLAVPVQRTPKEWPSHIEGQPSRTYNLPIEHVTISLHKEQKSEDRERSYSWGGYRYGYNDGPARTPDNTVWEVRFHFDDFGLTTSRTFQGGRRGPVGYRMMAVVNALVAAIHKANSEPIVSRKKNPEDAEWDVVYGFFQKIDKYWGKHTLGMPRSRKRVTEAEDVDWSPDPADPDSNVSTSLPVGYVVLRTAMSHKGHNVYLSKYSEWDGSYATPELHRARMFKKAATIERNWPSSSGRGFRPVPVYSKGNALGLGPAPTRKPAFGGMLYVKD